MDKTANQISYVPLYPPANADEFRRYIAEELYKVSAAISALAAGHVDTVHVAPSKPRAGDIRLADGTDWNPGSGQGLYAYYASAWHLLG